MKTTFKDQLIRTNRIFAAMLAANRDAHWFDFTAAEAAAERARKHAELQEKCAEASRRLAEFRRK